MDDAPQLARIHCLAWQAAYVGIMPANFLASLEVSSATERWRAILTDASGVVKVCERASGIVGFCSFGKSRDDDAEPNQAEIYSINVHPNEWRRGVGRELTSHAVADLRQRGFGPVTLWVASENGRARRFYEALGFSEEGRSRVEALRPSVLIPETRYVLTRLAA